MKPRKREVEIFNMSLLDILCGALGAFCFMMLALFPDYVHARKAGIKPKTAAEKAQDTKKKEKWNQVKRSVSTGVLVVRWDTPQDIDVYTQSPGGHWWGPKKIAGMTDDDLDKSQDSKGAGMESRAFTPGDLRVMYRVASDNGSTVPAKVYGFLTARSGLFDETTSMASVLPIVELHGTGDSAVADLRWGHFSPEQVTFRRPGP